MGRALRTVKGWLSWRNDAAAQIVVMLNFVVSVIAGVAAGAWLESKRAAIAVTAVVVLALTVALSHRRLAMIGAAAAAALVGLCAGAFGAALIGLGAAANVAGGAIGCAAFAGTFLYYRRFVRSTTGAGDLEGRYAGTFNERDEKLKKGSGSATVVVAATDAGDHDLRVTGLVVGGMPIELYGARREEETVIADLARPAGISAPFELLRGKAMLDGATLIVDLEGSPFGWYVFTGRRQRG
jgi:hypothetical protein